VPSDRLLARRFLFLRLLRASLLLGALYDFVFAALMATAPQVLQRLSGLPEPGERFYLLTIAILLAMLGALYVVAAHDPRRYAAIVFVGIAGRLAGAATFAALALSRPDLPGLWQLAAGDGAFGIAHLACWWPTRR
jgi:hypothetical protein